MIITTQSDNYVIVSFSKYAIKKIKRHKTIMIYYYFKRQKANFDFKNHKNMIFSINFRLEEKINIY